MSPPQAALEANEQGELVGEPSRRDRGRRRDGPPVRRVGRSEAHFGALEPRWVQTNGASKNPLVMLTVFEPSRRRPSINMLTQC